jgi:hypothetical protein
MIAIVKKRGLVEAESTDWRVTPVGSYSVHK